MSRERNKTAHWNRLLSLPCVEICKQQCRNADKWHKNGEEKKKEKCFLNLTSQQQMSPCNMINSNRDECIKARVMGITKITWWRHLHSTRHYQFWFFITPARAFVCHIFILNFKTRNGMNKCFIAKNFRSRCDLLPAYDPETFSLGF